VTKVVTFGAFVEILDGVEGLVHISELAPHHVESPREIVHPGDEIRVKILEIDSDRRRLSLSAKRVEDQILPVARPGEPQPDPAAVAEGVTAEAVATEAPETAEQAPVEPAAETSPEASEVAEQAPSAEAAVAEPAVAEPEAPAAAEPEAPVVEEPQAAGADEAAEQAAQASANGAEQADAEPAEPAAEPAQD
jgi:small subunit ribosomal protein S1